MFSSDGSPQFDNIVPSASTCGASNGSIIATVSGGVGALEYAINGIDFQSDNSFTGLAAGDYNITVRDANGCEVVSQITAISDQGGPIMDSFDAIPATCGADNGSITIQASGGNGNLSYSINGTDFQSNNDFYIIRSWTI